jgi:hypothetical protein
MTRRSATAGVVTWTPKPFMKFTPVHTSPARQIVWRAVVQRHPTNPVPPLMTRLDRKPHLLTHPDGRVLLAAALRTLWLESGTNVHMRVSVSAVCTPATACFQTQVGNSSRSFFASLRSGVSKAHGETAVNQSKMGARFSALASVVEVSACSSV